MQPEIASNCCASADSRVNTSVTKARILISLSGGDVHQSGEDFGPESCAQAKVEVVFDIVLDFFVERFRASGEYVMLPFPCSVLWFQSIFEPFRSRFLFPLLNEKKIRTHLMMRNRKCAEMSGIFAWDEPCIPLLYVILEEFTMRNQLYRRLDILSWDRVYICS